MFARHPRGARVGTPMIEKNFFFLVFSIPLPLQRKQNKRNLGVSNSLTRPARCYVAPSSRAAAH